MSKLVIITIKRITLASLAFLLAAFLLPLLLIPAKTEAEPIQEGTLAEFTPQRMSAQTEPEISFDEKLTIKATLSGNIEELSMRDYLIGVVAAEMPASFESEALKAQAVAARTHTVYKLGCEYSENHPETPVCDDIGCCKAFADEAQLRQQWGGDYDMYLSKIADAVKATDGVIVTYEEQPILAAFHSSSAGVTASSEEVWGGALPYLVSVESPESGGFVPNYISTVTVTAAEFKEKVLERFPAADLSGDIAGWVEIVSLTESGRVDAVKLGGVQTTGSVARALFSLRSAAFTVGASADGIVFTTAGYGHGVGMSQYGANTLAAEGATWDEILALYYPHTELTKLTPD